MSGTQVTGFKLEIRLDATVTIHMGDGEDAWVKPGASAATTWDNVPSPRELKAGQDYMMQEVVGPALGDVTEMVTERLKKIHGIS